MTKCNTRSTWWCQTEIESFHLVFTIFWMHKSLSLKEIYAQDHCNDFHYGAVKKKGEK